MDTESMYRRPVRGADEVDAFSAHRRAHPWNHGRLSRVKTGYTRRTRRTTRQAIRSGRV